MEDFLWEEETVEVAAENREKMLFFESGNFAKGEPLLEEGDFLEALSAQNRRYDRVY